MLTLEEWRDIKGYEGAYMVSSLGRVKSLDRVVTTCLGTSRRVKGKIVYCGKLRNGYTMVSLYKDGKTKDEMVHRLVAGAFLDKPKGAEEVNHINHKRDDNRKSNLEWCTHHENMIDVITFSGHDYQDSHNILETHKCVDCGKLITYKATRCEKCAMRHYANNHYRKISKSNLVQSLTNSKGNFVKAARDYGISDNALRKWCKKYDLPTHSKDWRNS